MNVPNSSSMIWIWARQVIMAAILFTFVLLAYKNSMETKDVIMILTTMSTILGLDTFKHVTSKPDSTTSESDKNG